MNVLLTRFNFVLLCVLDSLEGIHYIRLVLCPFLYRFRVSVCIQWRDASVFRLGPHGNTPVASNSLFLCRNVTSWGADGIIARFPLVVHSYAQLLGKELGCGIPHFRIHRLLHLQECEGLLREVGIFCQLEEFLFLRESTLVSLRIWFLLGFPICCMDIDLLLIVLDRCFFRFHICNAQ